MARFFGLIFCAAAAFAALSHVPVQAQSVKNPTVLQFAPVEDQYDRYMLRLSLMGTVVLPHTEPDSLLVPEFGINTVYEDRVTSVTDGVNRHRITYYTYDVSTLNFLSGMFGGGGGGGRRGGGGPGGGPGSAETNGSRLPAFGAFSSGNDPFSLPGSLGLAESGGVFGPMPEGSTLAPYQDDSDEKAGGVKSYFDLSKITTSNIDYITLKNGQVIDVRGLDTMSEYSDAQVANEEIIVDVRNLFEWSHMLVLPPYPIYIEDFWYAEIPLHVPGVPNPIPTKLYYQLMDFRRVLGRRIAVIDMSGLVEFDQYWERRDEIGKTWEKKYRAFGTMGVSARYMFDVDKKEIFAIARPPMDLPQYYRGGGMPMMPGSAAGFGGIGALLEAAWEMPHPGLAVSTRMRFFTKFEDKRKLRTSAKKEPEFVRKYIEVNYFAQAEAE